MVVMMMVAVALWLWTLDILERRDSYKRRRDRVGCVVMMMVVMTVLLVSILNSSQGPLKYILVMVMRLGSLGSASV